MAVLSDGNVLSKEFGSYQEGDVTVEGPAFIPPGGTARIALYLSYYYPRDFTKADQADATKVIADFDHRLNELNGFVLFDEGNHYQIDLPKGWQQKSSVKPDSPSPAPKN